MDRCLHICVYESVWICVYIHVYVCTRVYMCTYICVSVCVYIHMSVHVHVWVCVCECVCVCFYPLTVGYQLCCSVKSSSQWHSLVGALLSLSPHQTGNSSQTYLLSRPFFLCLFSSGLAQYLLHISCLLHAVVSAGYFRFTSHKEYIFIYYC